MGSAPSSLSYLAVIINVLLLALVFFVAVSLARKITQPLLLNIARSFFVLCLIIPLNFLRIQFPDLFIDKLLGGLGKVGILFVLCASVVAFLFLAWRRWNLVVHFALAVVMIMAPFALITVSQAAWAVISGKSAVAFLDKIATESRPSSKKPPMRVLWLIFDEMDYLLAFSHGNTTLNLPEFTRLRARSVYANHAFPPAGCTQISMPAYITGHLISGYEPVRSDELLITYDGEQQPHRWSSEPNIFSRMRDLGYKSALIGWYHPYCRVLEGPSACVWEEYYHPGARTLGSKNVGSAMRYQLIRMAETIPLIVRLGWVSPIAMQRKQHLFAYKRLMEAAKKFAVDPEMALVFAHLPVPHWPYIYDGAHQRFDISGPSTYQDNLALADRSLGEIRRAMERAGVWEDTAVLVTSDHWLRDRATGLMDHRVPFLLKLPKQEHSASFRSDFNTVLAHDLVLALLSGQVADSEGVLNWLDSYRTYGESPYNCGHS